MMDPRQEKFTLDDLVTTVIATLPKISRAAIDARVSFGQPMVSRQQHLSEAIRQAEMLAAYLRDRQQALGWKDPRSDAA